MDYQKTGSLNSLADYGLGESDIEDSDDEVESEGVQPIVVARPFIPQTRVKTSKLVNMCSTFNICVKGLPQELRSLKIGKTEIRIMLTRELDNHLIG